ncbi:MAG: GerMN domain-containing protein [Thermovirgaceae bacterium]|nr:GerMN domain-containing protein [Thermovirgaceae bacterium]
MTDFRDYERRPRRPIVDEDETEDLYEEEENGKAPLAYRAVAWVSVIVLLFAAGYWGTSLTLKFLDKRQIIGQENVVNGPEEAKRIAEDQSAPSGITGRRSGFDVFVPRGETIVAQSVSHVSGLLEDDVKVVISGLLETMRAENTISEQVRVLHVFRNGDLLYLDLNDPFTGALQKLSGPRANLVMTSLVRSIVQNFSPVIKVRFLVNGKDSDMKTPVDLTMPWQLKTSS